MKGVFSIFQWVLVFVNFQEIKKLSFFMLSSNNFDTCEAKFLRNKEVLLFNLEQHREILEF